MYIVYICVLNAVSVYQVLAFKYQAFYCVESYNSILGEFTEVNKYMFYAEIVLTSCFLNT